MSRELIVYGTMSIISLLIIVGGLFSVLSGNPNASLLNGSIMAVFTFWAGLIVPTPSQKPPEGQ
jgi:uncharacterized membrane protein (UPF0136 family)